MPTVRRKRPQVICARPNLAELQVSRFSQLYISQPSPLPDSARARRRIGKVLESLTKANVNTVRDLSGHLDQELGVPVNVEYGFEWPSFFEKAAIRDFLDAITLMNNFFLSKGMSAYSRNLTAEARRIFSEERLAFEIDDQGVVHPAVDQEFQRNRRATVAGLQDVRYANSLAAFERVSDELACVPPNGKDAWRAVFAAAEGLFRQMFRSAPQLNAAAIDAHLAPLAQRVHGQDAVALRATMKLIASFKDWVDASHNFRHEPGGHEQAQPPIDVAVLAVSNGTAFLRWLIALDQTTLAKSAQP
jgi:hypothetical protein